jgi:CheY-like chemotaxis protein
VLSRITNVLLEYDVVGEISPMAAVQLLEKQHFDIIITDYNMPAVKGIELLEEAQKIYKEKPYVGILCTAYGTTYLFEDEKEEGLFQFFLEKPFTTETLMKVVTRAVAHVKEFYANET